MTDRDLLAGHSYSNNIVKEIRDMKRRLMALEKELYKTGSLSNISDDLGLIKAGEIRLPATGSDAEPGDGFSGVRISGDAMTYASGTYNFVGVNNDVEQVGISAVDGKFYAAGGVVVLDEDGIRIESGNTSVNQIQWFDGAHTMQQIEVFETGGLTQGTIRVFRETEGDTSAILLITGGVNPVTGNATGLRLFADGTTGEASLRLYPSGASTKANMIIGGDGTNTPSVAEGIEIRGAIAIPATTLTIATGAITVARGFHRVDTESAAASDDLDTINGGADGYQLILGQANSARNVVLKHNTGNLALSGAADITLNNLRDKAVLVYDGTDAKWHGGLLVS